MTDLGVTAPAQTPTPPTKPPSDVPIWVVLLAVLVMLGLGGWAALILTHHSKPGITYPDHWDSRIAPYAKIAEKERGLLFEHPVAVHFLPPARFEKTVTSDDKDLSKQDRKDLAQFTGLMRAFGLLKGDVDLHQADNAFQGAGVLAYYSFDTKSITVRGEKVTPAMRSTLVHELTHVLQDQHFDIGDRMKKLGKESTTSTKADVLDAIIEGDAVRVEGLYRASLPAKQRKALDAGQQDDVVQADKRIKQVPKIVITMETSPYTLGEGLVAAAAADDGNAGVDKLFRHAPTHETALLDPFEVLAGHTGAIKLATPELKTGEKKFDSGELGVLTWYLMLAERLPLKDALAAADGWGGDAYVAFDRDGTSCARMSYEGHTPTDTNRMFVALHRWVVAAPGSSAKVGRDGQLVRFESCDPGKSAHVGKDSSEEAVGLVATRTALGVQSRRAGASDNLARCFAGKLIDAFPVSDLDNPKFGANDPAVKARVQQLAISCR